MKKITILTVLIGILFISGCQRWYQDINRSFQNSPRNYRVYKYSGGTLVFHDEFKGIINQEKGTDGIYYFKGDTLIEVAGDYVIKSDE